VTTNKSNPKENARYRKVIRVSQVGVRAAFCSIRVACYNPRTRNETCSVTFGIGPEDADTNSYRAVRIDEEEWNDIDASMREALRAAK
jgi:hypothetical protein